MLSGYAEHESDAIVNSAELAAYTPDSITDPEQYREQLRTDRALGYTYSPGRWVRGGAGVAAPYYDATGQVAGAIALSCPADRLEDLRVHEVGEAVADACARVVPQAGLRRPLDHHRTGLSHRGIRKVPEALRCAPGLFVVSD